MAHPPPPLPLDDGPVRNWPEWCKEHVCKEVVAERDRYRAALERIYQQGRGPHVALAREALDRG